MRSFTALKFGDLLGLEQANDTSAAVSLLSEIGMISEDTLKELIRELLAEHLEAQADWRTRVPSMVLIYPSTQHYLRSGFVGQKWMLKLCCMAPGEEHTLRGTDDLSEEETHPELGWYCLEDLGEWTGRIIKWAKCHQKILNIVSPRLGASIEWVHQNAVTSFLKNKLEGLPDMSLLQGGLPSGGGEYLPVSSSLIRLAGLNENDYRIIESQGLIFLQKVFEEHQPCGNLHLFIRNRRILWLCKQHFDKLAAERSSVKTVGSTDELLEIYNRNLLNRIDKIRIFGEERPRPIDEVFTELSLTEEHYYHSVYSELLGLIDTELRQRRQLFDNVAVNEEKDKSKSDSNQQKRTVRLSELFRERKQSILVGAPGSGKSTLLRYLAWTSVKTTHLLTVFLEFKTITKNLWDKLGGNLSEFLFFKAIAEPLNLEPPERERFRQLFFAQLMSGQVAIFLDGLDEVREAKFYKSLCRSINEFLHSNYRHNILIVSTRPYDVRSHFEGLKELEIAPLGANHVEQLIGRCYKGYPQINQLLRLLRRRRELQDLARVPLLLNVIAYVYFQQGEVIGERLELYRQTIQLLASSLDREKLVEKFYVRDPDGHIKRELLKVLAFERMFIDKVERDAERFVFSGDVILQKARQFCVKLNSNIDPYSLAYDVKATPLLREIGPDTYAFTHLTLQEYLAALALIDQAEAEKVFYRSFFNLTLAEMEVLPMALGLSSKPSNYYLALEQLPESITFTNLRLRVRGLAYVDELEQKHLENIATSLIELVIHRNIEEQPYVDPVLRSFSLVSGPSLDFIVNRLAAILLDKACKKRAVSLLKYGDEFDHVPWFVTTALGELGGKQSADSLLAALREGAVELRWWSIEALERTGDERAEFLLIDGLYDKDYLTRERAANALWKICGTRARHHLFGALKSENPDVRVSVVNVLGVLKDGYSVPSLIECLKDKTNIVRKAAAVSLGKTGGNLAAKALLTALDDVSKDVRISAACGLAEIGELWVEQILLDLTNDGDAWNARAPALKALMRLRGEQADEVLLKSLLNDTDSYVRAVSASLLASIGGRKIKRILSNAVKDDDIMVRGAAAHALADLCGEEDADILIEALKIGDYGVNKIIAQPLARTRNKRGERALLEVFESSLAWSVAPAIATIGHDRIVETLLWMSVEPTLFQISAKALSMIDSKHLASGLLRAISTDNKLFGSFIRSRAIRFIGYYNEDEHLLEELSNLAETDPNLKVRKEAVEAWEKLYNKFEFIN